MYRTTRSPMMQPLVNSGMGMAPFFKVNVSLCYTKNTHNVFVICPSLVDSQCPFLRPPQVTVFEQEHFQGKCLEFTSECCNIQECGLDNIRSIRVESGA